MKSDTDYKQELKEIREALEVAEGLRFKKGLSETDHSTTKKGESPCREDRQRSGCSN